MNKLAMSAALALATGLGAAALRPAEAADDQKPYTVVDGKVDKGTYNGYRRYTDACLRCHGPDGAGSSYAPNLTDSLKHLSHDDFVSTVMGGKQDLSAGQEKVMPAFGNVSDVTDYLEDIYGYLKARSDGVLDRGRPERLPPDKDPKANS